MRIAANLPFSRESLFRQFGPLVGISLLTLLRAAPPRPLGPGSGVVVQAAFLAAIAAAATLVLPWDRLPRSIQFAPPIVYLVVVFLAREAPGDAGPAYSQLVMIPVVWLALYGRPRELTGVLVAVAVTLFAPLMVPGTGPAAWTHAFRILAISAALGFGVELFIGQMRSHTARLYELAITDALTGTLNRRGWEMELSRAMGEARARNAPVSVAMIDLDHFKEYNDERGHQAGDRLLKEIAAKWSAHLRIVDVLARFGGDEFGVIVRDAPLQEAYAAVYRLWLSLPYGVSCSAGVASWDGAEGGERLLARADSALYRAKEAGRNRVLTAKRIELLPAPIEEPAPATPAP